MLDFPRIISYVARLHGFNQGDLSAENWVVIRDAYEMSFSSNFDPLNGSWVLNYKYKSLKSKVSKSDIGNYKDDMKLFSDALHYEMGKKSTKIPFKDINYWMLCLLVLALAVGVILSLRWYQYSPGGMYLSGTGDSIGGWLWILALNIVLQPFSILWWFIMQEGPQYLLLSKWHLSISDSIAITYFYKLLLTIEFFGNVLILCGSILLVFFIFKSIFHFTDQLIVDALFNDNYFNIVSPSIWRTWLFTVTWIVYLKRSTRAQRTFVNTINDDVPINNQNDDGIITKSEL